MSLYQCSQAASVCVFQRSGPGGRPEGHRRICFCWIQNLTCFCWFLQSYQTQLTKCPVVWRLKCCLEQRSLVLAAISPSCHTTSPPRPPEHESHLTVMTCIKEMLIWHVWEVFNVWCVCGSQTLNTSNYKKVFTWRWSSSESNRFTEFTRRIVRSSFSQENIKRDKLSLGKMLTDNANNQPTKQPNKQAEF